MRSLALAIRSRTNRFFQAKTLRGKVLLASDGAGWILDEVAEALHAHLPASVPRAMSKKAEWRIAKNSLIHFIERSWASQRDFLDDVHSSNQVIGLWWHGKTDSPDPNIQNALQNTRKQQDRLDLVQVPTLTAFATMLEIGIPREKIVFLPEGVDCQLFNRERQVDRFALRTKCGIPEDSFVVGSFQKDGNGWEDGEEPKLIKGPDTFADMLIAVHKKHPIFVFVPGPARGYVIGRLRKAGVPFANPGFVADRNELSDRYHVLDMYVSPSRDEGGPAGVLEAMASGVPVVSTRSGMPLDMIESGENGFLADVEDAEGLAECALRLIDDPALAQRMAVRGHETIQEYDWRKLAPRYYKELYQPLGW